VFKICSVFVFDPAMWPRIQMEEDFLRISKTFNAMRSVIRVPALDPKYKIAILASKQVCINVYNKETFFNVDIFMYCNVFVKKRLLYIVAGPLFDRFAAWMAGWKTLGGYYLCD